MGGNINANTVRILDGMMGNFESWNSKFKKELAKRNCIDVNKYQYEEEGKVAVIANKNVAMFLKKSVKNNFM